MTIIVTTIGGGMATTAPEPQQIGEYGNRVTAFAIAQYSFSDPTLRVVQEDGTETRVAVPIALFRAALDDYVRHEVSCNQMGEWMADPTFERVRIDVVRDGMADWFLRRARQHAIPRLQYVDEGATFLDGAQAAHSYRGRVVDAAGVSHWVTGFGSTKKAAEHDAMMQAREIAPNCERTDLYTGEDRLWGH